MLVRLQLGSITALPMDVKEGAKHIDRPAMLVYEGEFESMDGPVTVTAEHIQNLADAHNAQLSRVKRLANGELPPQRCPPIQLDHTSSARDTVGRLVSELKVGSFANDEGEEVAALFGTLRFLGVDNCERVMDGRWTDLSIGADFENSVLSEITVTPFPAAKGSALLSSKRKGAPKVTQLGTKKIEGVDVNFWEITSSKGAKSWESSWKDSRGRVLQDANEESVVSLERLMAKAIRKDKKLSATRIEAFEFPGKEAEIHQKDDGKYFGRMYIGQSVSDTPDRNTIEEVKIDLKEDLDKLDNALESPLDDVDGSAVGPDGVRLASDYDRTTSTKEVVIEGQKVEIETVKHDKTGKVMYNVHWTDGRGSPRSKTGENLDTLLQIMKKNIKENLSAGGKMRLRGKLERQGKKGDVEFYVYSTSVEDAYTIEYFNEEEGWGGEVRARVPLSSNWPNGFWDLIKKDMDKHGYKLSSGEASFHRLKLVDTVEHKGCSIHIDTDPEYPGAFFFSVADKNGRFFQGYDYGSKSAAIADAKKAVDSGAYKKWEKLSARNERLAELRRLSKIERLAGLKKSIRLSVLKKQVRLSIAR